jgi:inhibitor of cysteine peptidase
VDRYLSEADDGKVLEAAPGDAIIVRLEENPSTGYRWAVDEIEGDAVIAEADDFVRSPARGVGGGGHRTFTFSAKEPGMALIAVKRWREWGGEDSVVERFRASVRVGAAPTAHEG